MEVLKDFGELSTSQGWSRRADDPFNCVQEGNAPFHGDGNLGASQRYCNPHHKLMALPKPGPYGEAAKPR